MVCKRTCCNFLSIVSGRVFEQGLDEDVVDFSKDESESVGVM